MAFTPDLPFPKSAGDPIKSKDWNDLVTETKRLDTAKVERAGDAITGSLSVAGTLAVGKTVAAATAKLDVAGDLRINDKNLYFRGSTDTNHGLGWYGPGKLFSTLSPDGPVLYGNAGGALGIAPGGAQSVALSWDANSNVAIGVASADLKVDVKLDVGDRVRLRQGAHGSAGMWLYQSAPAADRGFIGMLSDNAMGMYGTGGIGWGLTMDVSTGAVGVRASPSSSYGLYVNANAVGSVPAMNYGALISGGNYYALYVAGRSYDYSLRSRAYATNSVNTTATSWTDMPNMQLSVTLPANIGRYFHILAVINGVQTQGPSNNVGAYFRLLIDGTQHDLTRHEFNNNGWELRGVTLTTLAYLGAGSHTISVQWFTTSGTLTCCWYGDTRQIQAIEL